MNEKVYDAKVQNLTEENEMDIWLAYTKITAAYKHANAIYGKMPTASWNLAHQLGGLENSHDMVALRERLKNLRSLYHASFKGVKCGKKTTKQNPGSSSPAISSIQSG